MHNNQKWTTNIKLFNQPNKLVMQFDKIWTINKIVLPSLFVVKLILWVDAIGLAYKCPNTSSTTKFRY